MQLVNAEDLLNLVTEIFQKRGVTKEGSGIAANALVHAEIRGVDSHGVMRVAHYVKRLEIGSINPKPQERLEKTGPVTAFLDGDNGLGHVNTWHAMEVAVEMAKANGVGMVGVRNSSHCGALSFYASQAMEAGLIGLAMVQTDSCVVPFGGTRPFLGTNPLCVAIPSAKGTPILLDMATSTVAGGHIIKARAENRPIPEGWALDAESNPTTDPHAARYYTPLGGYKGFGLGVIVEVLTGLLMGGAFGPHVTPMYGEYEKTRALCHLVGAIDYNRFPGKSSFLERVTQMVDEIHRVPTAGGFSRVQMPGEPEHLTEMDRKKNGIPLQDYLWKELLSLVGP